MEGRIFCKTTAEYRTRDQLLLDAGLPEDIHQEVEVFVGFDEVPISEGAWTHLFPGSQVAILPTGLGPPPDRPLGQQLLDRALWSENFCNSVLQEATAYCVVRDAASHLYLPAQHSPIQYRNRLAHTVGVDPGTMRIQAAQPQLRDADIEGHACRSVLAVALGSEEDHLGPWHSCLIVDCRSIGGSWCALVSRNGYLPLGELDWAVGVGPPLGWDLHVDAEVIDGQLQTRPGQVFVVEFVRSADASQPSMPAVPASTMTDDVSQDSAVNAYEDQAASSDPIRGEVAAHPSFGAPRDTQEDWIPFQIFAQEYWPEAVSVRLRLPMSPGDACAAVAQAREAQAQRRSPRLVAVSPQPLASQARIFAAIVPHRLRCDDLLRLAEIPETEHCQIYVHDVPWPVQPDSVIVPNEGDLVIIRNVGDEHEYLPELASMLQPGHTWDTELQLPGADPGIVWVLTDGVNTAVPIQRDSFARDNAAVSSALGLVTGQFLLVPTIPGIEDHARAGTRSENVQIACQTAHFSSDSI
ncbi:CFDP2, partial [Symbiodinium sp. CCMP2456]